ncbi:MAG: hypothetical protein IPO61_05970 [Gammaproteobacteria bacterium]|nr:hypothetical protein [Gammaproteobacteria bacterium]
MLEQAAREQPDAKPPIGRETIRRLLKKNCLKAWRKVTWCIGVLTEECRPRKYGLFDLDARPFRMATTRAPAGPLPGAGASPSSLFHLGGHAFGIPAAIEA